MPSSVSLRKALKSTDPKADPYGTPLVTGLHPDMEPLITALWLQSANHSLIHQSMLQIHTIPISREGCGEGPCQRLCGRPGR